MEGESDHNNDNTNSNNNNKRSITTSTIIEKLECDYCYEKFKGSIHRMPNPNGGEGFGSFCSEECAKAEAKYVVGGDTGQEIADLIDLLKGLEVKESPAWTELETTGISSDPKTRKDWTGEMDLNSSDEDDGNNEGLFNSQYETFTKRKKNK